MTASYTPGHSRNATDFMSRRTLESHGAFFAPYLKPGMRVLDVGCGPGSITHGIANLVTPGGVVGIDMGDSQIATARASASPNERFVCGSCYDLPFGNEEFDAVFSHALLEHLAEPERAVAEFARVLKPDGYIGLCCPDWGGFLLAPPSPELDQAITAYRELQTRNGGNVFRGRELSSLLTGAGFRNVNVSARYECYESCGVIAEYLALQLDEADESDAAATLRKWAVQEGTLFAQAWISAVGRKWTLP